MALDDHHANVFEKTTIDAVIDNALIDLAPDASNQGTSAHPLRSFELGDFGLAADGSGDKVLFSFRASGRGVLPAVENDLQVELIPLVLWK